MQKLYTAELVYVKDQFQNDQAIFVVDGVIKEVGPKEGLIEKYKGIEKIDWNGKAIVPGTINAHNHSFQSLLRGMAVDLPFLDWRNQALYRYTPFLDEDAIYTGALFAFGEMLKYGVTTVSDFFYVHNGWTATDEAVIQAATDLGIRLVFARTMYDWNGAPIQYRETVKEAVQRTYSLAKKYQGHPMISIHPAPHSPHGASPEMIKAGHQLAQQLDTPFHIHVAEEMFEVEETLQKFGLRPVHYLDSLGVIDKRMIAIHLVWLEDSEITLLGNCGASLAYCPSSNMFLADGVSKIPELLAAGMRISLGSDGACSNNRISVFEEMRMCSLLQKVSRLDGTCINAKQVFQLGTKAGAELLQLPVGEIKVGLKADFVTLNLNDLSLSPKTELFANMIYSMQPTAICDVIVNGKTVVENGKLNTMREELIVKKVNALIEKWHSDRKTE